MPNHLESIVASVRRAEAAAMRAVPFDALLAAAGSRRAAVRAGGAGSTAAFRSLRSALVADPSRPAVIAEIKRASPSRGDLAPDLDPAELARAYEAGGAAALSVLTEPSYFKGAPEDLQRARAAVALPVLRKDFVLSEYAVAASAAMGADALLLIARLLAPATLARLHGLAAELGLECLVEVHDEADLERIGALRPPLVGINNRDLESFETDTGRAARLAARLPAGTIPVALSGMATPADLAAAGRAGIRCFLVGEALVRAADPGALLKALRAAGG